MCVSVQTGRCAPLRGDRVAGEKQARQFRRVSGVFPAAAAERHDHGLLHVHQRLLPLRHRRLRGAARKDGWQPCGAPVGGRDERRRFSHLHGATGDATAYGDDGQHAGGRRDEGGAGRGEEQRVAGAVQGERGERDAVGAAKGARLFRLRRLQESAEQVEPSRGCHQFLSAPRATANGAPRHPGCRRPGGRHLEHDPVSPRSRAVAPHGGRGGRVPGRLPRLSYDHQDRGRGGPLLRPGSQRGGHHPGSRHHVRDV
mmetsp:Transcript_16957/g.30294  ORF Transcript_16957/g.30294 Transcript_16957/m.30294 type:complete len:256 (+) Transcript_16957:1005-1772(+)